MNAYIHIYIYLLIYSSHLYAQQHTSIRDIYNDSPTDTHSNMHILAIIYAQT